MTDDNRTQAVVLYQKTEGLMDFEQFRNGFILAAQNLREQITNKKLRRTDVAAMQCVIAAGLPSTPRQHLPVWVLLVATLPPDAIDYDEMMQMSYRLTFPWWRRACWRMADAYRNLEYDAVEVKLRSYD